MKLFFTHVYEFVSMVTTFKHKHIKIGEIGKGIICATQKSNKKQTANFQDYIPFVNYENVLETFLFI